ncbi:MAG TPA: Ig-like domain repeat protein, partial [Gemmataceae bacterium]|nr:Ig-like domain repeat protein [Gemmataceae bacterium]
MFSSWLRGRVKRKPKNAKRVTGSASHSIVGWKHRTRLVLELLEDRLALAAFTVTSVLDDGSAGTLRWAINQANVDTDPTSFINFNILASGVQTIQVGSSSPYAGQGLPALTHPTTIDGTTEPGFAGTPIIVLNGSQAGAADGLDITGGDSTIKGFVIQQFQGNGLVLEGLGRDLVQGNFIGTNAAGTATLGNLGDGIYVSSSANTIGGTASGAGNLISGNGSGGIDITGTVNVVQGNDIGTNAAGTAAVANGGSGVNIAAPTSATIREFAVPTPNSGLDFMAAGPDGNVWFEDVGSGDLAEITPAGQVIPVPTPLPVGDFVFGPDGNIWFAGDFTNGESYIGEMTPSGTLLHDYAIRSSACGHIAGTSTALVLTLGPDGNIWYTEPYVTSDVVGRLTPSGQITEFSIGFDADGIVTGPDGNLWFTATSVNDIGRITPTGSITIFDNPVATVPSAFRYTGMIAGPNGNLWMATANTIAEMNTSGQTVAQFQVSGDPYGLAAGPDGNVWYDEGAADDIGRITPQGVVTEFPIPTPKSGAEVPVWGPDGNMWFTEYGSGQIGKVLLNPANSALSNTIGGTTAAARNVISGNTGDGVDITGNVTTGNFVEGNYIGTDGTGTNALGNMGNGVNIQVGASNNTIGGGAVGAGNVISGNVGAGVLVNGLTTSGNLSDNFSTNHDYANGNVSGTGWDGVLNPGNLFSGDANLTTSGALTWSAVANVGWENDLDNGPVLYKTVTGDFDASVHVSSMTSVIFSDGGLIARVPASAGNPENYVALRYFGAGGFNATRNTVNSVTTNNNYPNLQPWLRLVRVGDVFSLYTKAAATDPWTLWDTVTRPDIGSGTPMQVGLWFGTFLTGNIGTVQFDNFNLATASVNATGNSIRGNSIHDNAGLGIDLGGSGVPVPNDSHGHSGPNNFQNFPMLISAFSSATYTTATGTFSELNTIICLDFYASISPDPSGYGQGQTFLGSYQVATDANGSFAFSIPRGVLAPAPAGESYLTATATDPSGDTSEFSPDCYISLVTPTVFVTDAGGTYDGQSFPASVSVNGGPSFDNAFPTLTYYTGATGTPVPSAPAVAGTYTVVASFAATWIYTSASAQTTFTISPAAPAVTVSDGGTYDGQPFPASATVNGGTSLEGISPTLSYYAGNSATGTPLAGPPTTPGAYTVVASFPGSQDYTSASAQAAFIIIPKPSTFVVTDALDVGQQCFPGDNPMDTDGLVSLRSAIAAANFDAGLGGADTIAFCTTQMRTSTIVLALGQLELTAGAGMTTINGGGLITVSGNNQYTIFAVDGGASATLEGLTITDGNGFNGGGIFNAGALTVNDSTISGNSGENDGGGIYNSGQITLYNSTLSRNSARYGYGGGLDARGVAQNVTISGSTISDNTAGDEGGGVALFSLGSGRQSELLVQNSTISGNTAVVGGGIFGYDPNGRNIGQLTNATIANNRSYYGGGISGMPSGRGGVPSFALNNTIVADNLNLYTGSADDINGYINVGGACNLIGTGGSGGLQNGVNGNQVGVENAGLASLANNGGLTETMAPMTGSPAIGNGSAALAVDANGNPLLTDQRGFGYLRTVNDPTTGIPTTDIGAYQTQPSSLSASAFLETVVSGTLPVDTNGNPSAAFSLDAQNQADAFMGVFSSSNPSPLTVPSGSATPIDIVVSLASDIEVNEAALSIPAGFRVSINGGTWYGGSPALTLNAGNLTVTNATFQNTTDAPTILVTGGSLTLSNDVVQESTGFTDAAISVSGGTLNLGTTASPGGNALNVDGTGEFVHNTTGSLISAVGDTFEINGVAQAAPFLSFTALTSSAANSVYGHKVTLTATVTPDTTGATTPSGSVDFYDVSTSTDLGTVSLAGGSASLDTSALGVGSHLIRLTYAGDSNYLPSLDSVTQTVTPATLILTVTANNATMVYGSALPAFSDTITGFVNGDTAGVVSGAASLTTTATSSSGVGAYTITASQ